MAVAENPAGIELKIQTRDDRHQLAVSKLVEFEEVYSAKYPGEWQIEILDYWNEASVSTVVYVTDGVKVWSQPRLYGIICCDSRHVWLSLDPVRLPYKLATTATRFNPEGAKNPEWYTLKLPAKPGKYQLYVTTRRVYGSGYSGKTYRGKGVAVTSDILTLEVK